MSVGWYELAEGETQWWVPAKISIHFRVVTKPQNMCRNGAPVSSRCEQLLCENTHTHTRSHSPVTVMYRFLAAGTLCGLIQHLVHCHLGRPYYHSSFSSRQKACISLRAQLAESTALRIRTLDQTSCKVRERGTNITCIRQHTRCRYVLTTDWGERCVSH